MNVVFSKRLVMLINNTVKTGGTIVVVLSAIVFSSFSLSHEGATGIIKERMDSMKTMQDHAKPVQDMFKGRVDFDLQSVKTASQIFIEHGEKIPVHYPDTWESRQGPMTEALPKIWDDWDGFTKYADQLVEDSNVLLTFIENSSASIAIDESLKKDLETLYLDAAKNCFNCHKKFRKDKN